MKNYEKIKLPDHKTVILLCGPSGCGKSTLESQLTSLPSVYKIVSTTTREPRGGEEDRVDYYFRSKNQFDVMQAQNKFIQTTEFAGNSYGTELFEYITFHDFATLVITPESAKRFIPTLLERIDNISVKLIYFDISNERLIQNMRARGDSEEMIEARIAEDDLREQFKKSGLVTHFRVTDDTLDEKLFERVCTQFHIGN